MEDNIFVVDYMLLVLLIVVVVQAKVSGGSFVDILFDGVMAVFPSPHTREVLCI